MEQMVPPIVKWLSGIMPSCERNVVELNRSGPITGCAFTETVKEWGSHRPGSICSCFLSVCTIKDPQTNVYLFPQPRANKQIEVEKHIKHTTGRGVILNILINVLIKESDGTGAEKCQNVGVECLKRLHHHCWRWEREIRSVPTNKPTRPQFWPQAIHFRIKGSEYFLSRGHGK